MLLADTSARRLVSGQTNLNASRPFRAWLLPGIESVVEMARVGHGIAVLPDWAAHLPVMNGTLVPLKLAGPSLKRTCCAWWAVNRPLSWASEVFLSIVVTAWSEMTSLPTPA
jgi:DNA-binding transcriptional LysR family regulator